MGILMLPHQPDQKTLIATMLHDLIEDTEATEKDIEFLGDEIMEMIDGLTKISQSHIQNEKQ